MNDFPSFKRLIIWIENKVEFERSWDILISSDAELIYPAHGKPFCKSDLVKYKKIIPNIHLYKLK